MLFYFTIIIGVILDIISKNLAFIYLQNQVNIFGDILYFKYALNPGIAFSIKVPPAFLKILTIILIIIIFYYYINEKKGIKNKKHLLIHETAFGLILAGAIGNAIGRIFNSNVIDFIGVKYFAIFNLADVLINIGAILYIYLILKKYIS